MAGLRFLSPMLHPRRYRRQPTVRGQQADSYAQPNRSCAEYSDVHLRFLFVVFGHRNLNGCEVALG